MSEKYNMEFDWESFDEVPIFCGCGDDSLEGVSKQIYQIIEDKGFVPVGYRCVYKAVEMSRMYSDMELILFFQDLEMMCGYQAKPFGVLYLKPNFSDVEDCLTTNEKKIKALLHFIEKNRSNIAFVFDGVSSKCYKRLVESFDRVLFDGNYDEDVTIGFKL